MPDIAMCTGGTCPRKQKCYRYIAVPDEYAQTYFSDPPVEPDGNCSHYWTTDRGEMDKLIRERRAEKNKQKKEVGTE